MIRKARSYGSAEEKQATQSARLTTAVLIVLGIAAFFSPLKKGIPVVCGAKAVSLSPSKSSLLGSFTMTGSPCCFRKRLWIGAFITLP